MRARTKDVLYDEPYDEALSGGDEEKHPTNSTERHRPIREMEGVPVGSSVPKRSVGQILAAQAAGHDDDSDESYEEPVGRVVTPWLERGGARHV